MGTADDIVDLVSSSTTLLENNLKEVEGGTVLQSQETANMRGNTAEEVEQRVISQKTLLSPDERYDEYRLSSDFIKEYIFPGGCLPSLSRITSAMSTSSRSQHTIYFLLEHEKKYQECLVVFGRDILWIDINEKI